MTKLEVTQWMATQSFDELVQFIIIADDWENSTPEISLPIVHAFLEKEGDLTLVFEGKITVSIGTVSPLQFQTGIQPMVFEDFYVEKKKAVWPWFAVGGGGILTGIIIHSLTH